MTLVNSGSVARLWDGLDHSTSLIELLTVSDRDRHNGSRIPRPLSAEQINAQNAAMLRWENEVIAREIKRRPANALSFGFTMHEKEF
jgi:hypothetical protein